MQTSGDGSVRLQVGTAYPDDEGTSLGRMSRKTLKALGVDDGDLVEVRAERLIVVTAATAHMEDDGLDLIRLDARDREQAGVDPGQFAEVRAARVHQAQRVMLAQTRPGRELGESESGIRQALLGYVVSRGAVLHFWLSDRQIEGRLRVLGIDVLEAVAQAGDAEPLALRVTWTDPEGAVRIDEDTAIELAADDSAEPR